MDLLSVIARQYEITLIEEIITAQKKSQMYERMRLRLAEDQIELAPDSRLREELLRVRKTATRTGYGVDSPILADGSHGDLASAVVLSLNQPIPEPVLPAKILSPLEHDLLQMQKDRQNAIQQVAKNNKNRLKNGKF
jgi:hypothetical protein